MMKAILFDFDGTLIDSSEGITKSAQYALAHFGIEEPNLDDLKKFIGPPLGGSFQKFYGFSREQADEAVRVYRSRYEKIGLYECRLYPHVKETICRLKEDGYLIGLASSKPEVTCRRIMEHLEILDLFDEVVGATHDGRIGTKEEVLLEVLRRWQQIPRGEMLLVGDTIYDVEGANLVHMKSIGVSFGFGNLDEMRKAGAISIIDDMLQLPQEVAVL